MWGLLFRLPWFVYLALAPLVLVGAGYGYFDDQHSESEKAMALRGKPPAAVAIESFQAARDVGRAHEVVVTGQVDMAHAMELTETKSGSERHHWVLAPIYPSGAADTTAPAIGVLVHDGALMDSQLLPFVKANGAFGPVMTINGLLADDLAAQEAVRKGIADKVKLSASPVRVDPFVNGRSVGLAPKSDGEYVAIGLAILALILVGFGFYKRSQVVKPYDFTSTEPGRAA